MGALTLAVTGAGGFVGRAVVAEARARGHRVIAVVRRGAELPGAEVRMADLPEGAGAAIAGADRVIHAAGRLSGTAAEMVRDNVTATDAVAQAAAGARAGLVLISSLAVEAARPLSPGEEVRATELGNLPPATGLDLYTRVKRHAEETARARMLGRGGLCTLRPGIVWAPGHLGNAHLGVRFGPVMLRIGGDGELPLCHLRNLARAAVLAAEMDPPRGTFAVVDDERPTRGAYLAAMGVRSVPLSWRVLDLAAGMLARWEGRMPGLLRRRVLRWRLMPLRYSNAGLREALGWEPAVSFEDGMREALAWR